MLLQLYLLLVARIPEEEEEEEELQRKDDDDEEVEEEDIALLVLLAMFVLLVSIVVAADANMTRYNLSAAYRYFLFFVSRAHVRVVQELCRPVQLLLLKETSG